MEIGFGLAVAASVALGLALRRRLSRRTGRVLLGSGFASLALGIVVLGLAALGLWPFGSMAGGLLAALLLAFAAVAAPFGVTVAWRRSAAADGRHGGAPGP